MKSYTFNITDVRFPDIDQRTCQVYNPTGAAPAPGVDPRSALYLRDGEFVILEGDRRTVRRVSAADITARRLLYPLGQIHSMTGHSEAQVSGYVPIIFDNELTFDTALFDASIDDSAWILGQPCTLAVSDGTNGFTEDGNTVTYLTPAANGNVAIAKYEGRAKNGMRSFKRIQPHVIATIPA